MKKSLFRLFAVILAMLTLAASILVVSAAPTDAYTYWDNIGTQKKPVYSKPMYDVDSMIDVKALGVKALTKINAMCNDDEGNIYILDAASRIIILDKDFNLVKEIGAINGNIAYNEAKGIYYDNKYDELYICNTEGDPNAKEKVGNIYIIDTDGNLKDTINLPDSPLIPDDLNFRPTRVARDDNDYMYVVSESCFYGALLYSPEREFLGFYGANTTEATITSVFTNISNRLFPNAEKHATSIKKLPNAFVDIEMDSEGFVYTSNAMAEVTTASRKGQIRKLSPGAGKNIFDSEINFGDKNILWLQYQNRSYSKLDFCDIEVDSRDYIYALESKFDKIYIYDSDCRTVTIFGGGMETGNQKGVFSNASAMILANDGDQILVADQTNNFITVFNINDYGKLVKELNHRTLNGFSDYMTADGTMDSTMNGWSEVLKQDANSQLAYSGIAKAYLDQENYDEALKYAKLGYDKETYGVAFEYVRKQFISDNFIWIFIVLVVVVIGAIVFMFVTNKKKIILIKNKSLNLLLTTMIHPSNNFTDIKEKQLGSIPLCFVMLLLYYVVTIMQTIAGGFLFSNYDPTTFNSIFVLVRSVGLVVLWILANWLVSTLLGGKGKLKEIMIVTCYSLQPLILTGAIHIILSNVLLPVEGSFLGILSTIGTIYFVLMLIIGLLKIHDYTMGELIWTSLLSIIGIAIIVFLMVMLIILVQQFGAFVLTVITELATL